MNKKDYAGCYGAKKGSQALVKDGTDRRTAECWVLAGFNVNLSFLISWDIY